MKIRQIVKLMLLVSLVSACASLSPLLPAHARKEPVSIIVGPDQIEGRIVGRMRANSPFSSLSIGMTRSEVENLIGNPTNVDAQTMGSTWVPFYFGNDLWRTESYYRKEGRLVFNSDSRLILIDVSETARN